MNDRVPPGAEELAHCLLAHESNGRKRPEDLLAATDATLLKLRHALSRLLGTEGISSIEARALVRAERLHPVLGPVWTGGSSKRALDEARASLAERDPREAVSALRAVCVQLIGLLFTFLGEDLTTHIVYLTWPDLPADGTQGRERDSQ